MFRVVDFLCLFSISCFDPESLNESYVAGCRLLTKDLQVLVCIDEDVIHVPFDFMTQKSNQLNTLAIHNTGPACDNPREDRDPRMTRVQNLILDEAKHCKKYYFTEIWPQYLTVTNTEFNVFSEILDDLSIQRFNIEGIYIRNVPVNDLIHIDRFFSASLKTFHCIKCGIESFDVTVFQQAVNLKALSLRNNQIKRIFCRLSPNVQPLNNLWSLDLRDNPLGGYAVDILRGGGKTCKLFANVTDLHYFNVNLKRQRSQQWLNETLM